MSMTTIRPAPWRFAMRPVPAELAYWVGIPLLMALHLGWHHAGATSLGQRTVEMGYFSGLALLGWCSLVLCTSVLFHVFRPLRPRPWLLWLGGALLALLALSYPKMVYVQLSDLFLARPYGGVQGPYLSWPHIVQAAVNAPPGIIAWMAVNFFYDRVLRLPRFHYPPVPESQPLLPRPAPEAEIPDFLRGLDPPIRSGEVLMLEACDHYIRVHTAGRTAMLHHRFRDAIQQMSGQPGAQVHRSYWVAASVMRALEKSRHGHRLALATGAHVPVSRTYLKELRQLLASLSG